MRWIQALRALAVLAVVSFHAFQWIDDRFWVGGAGVDVFFVISGFIIWTIGSRDEASPGKFFWRRFTRVAPAYWLMTAVTIAIALAWPSFLPQVSLSARHIALSFAFVQHTDPNGLVFPVLPPGWSLNYEAVFYGLFTLVLFAPARWRYGLILAALVGVVVLGLSDPPLYGLGANPMMLQFAAGVWLARQSELGRLRIDPGAGRALAILGVLIFIAMAVTGVRNEFFRPLFWGAPAFLIVAGGVAAEAGRGPPAWLARLGDASYAIYLTHLPVVALVARGIGVRPIWLFVPLAVLASLATGVAFHIAVERPLIVGVRRLPALIGGAGLRAPAAN